MKLEIEELNPVKRILKVEVPPEVVTREFSHAYAELQRKVKLPGFRPGKAPLSLLERKYAREIEEDIVQKLVPDYYRKAVREAGLHPVELPSIEQISVKKGEPLSFRATVEIRPSLTLSDYLGLKLTRKPVNVPADAVEKALLQLQQEHGQLESCEPDHVIQTGDYVIIDFEGFTGGEPVPNGSQKGYLLEVGARVLLPEIEDALIGRKAGEAFEANVSLPPDHPQKALAAKDVQFKIQVGEVKRKVLPALDDDFAKDLGVAGLKELRGRLQEEIEKRLISERTSEEKERLIKTLIGQHRFEVPPSLVEREFEDILSRIESHRRMGGGSQQDAPLKLEALQKEYMPVAEERARSRILLQIIAEQEKLKVEERELDEEIGLMARSMQATAQEVKQWVLARQGSLEGLRTRIIERKALDLLHEKAEIVEE